MSGAANVLFLTFGASDEVYYVGRFTSEVLSDTVNRFIAGKIGFERGIVVQVCGTCGTFWIVTWGDGDDCGVFRR